MAAVYSARNDATLYCGDRLDLLAAIPSGTAQLVVTSPPYNIGKAYEERVELKLYLKGQEETLAAAYECLDSRGSLCWQVGNHVDAGEILPLDIPIFQICKRLGFKLRNRIVWHFEHGLHCSRRFSGRYETVLWFTKSERYRFNLDPVRVPQKYPGKKAFKGPRKGEFTCNPLGKNPGDVWIIPNVKHNHVEKTEHPCQFPIELVERFVLALTSESDLVVDPFIGVGSTACAALLHSRRAAGADVVPEYLAIAKERIAALYEGRLARRQFGKPIYRPDPRQAVARHPHQPDTDLLPISEMFLV